MNHHSLAAWDIRYLVVRIMIVLGNRFLQGTGQGDPRPVLQGVTVDATGSAQVS
jgi:hypothetical protein